MIVVHNSSSSSTKGSGSGTSKVARNSSAERMASVGKRRFVRYRRNQDVNGSMMFVTRFNKKTLGVTIA